MKKQPLNKAKDLLHKSEARYKLLVNSIRDYAIFMMDPSGNIVTWNAGAEKINGYSRDKIIGENFSRFYTKEDIESGLPQQALIIAEQEGRFEHEGWNVRKDGSLFWTNVVITSILDADRGLLGFSKVIRDLTGKKKLEDKLGKANRNSKRNEEKIHLLIDGIKDYAIIMLTPSGNIATWNTGAERMKGYKAEEVIGAHFSILYPKEAVARGFPQYELEKVREVGRFEDEGWRIRKDGSAFWANVIISPIYNGNRLVGFSKVTRDLSEKVRNEHLMRKNRELLKINTDLDNFVYIASHDLKSPIANLEGLVSMLRKKAEKKLNRLEQEILGMIDASIHKLKITNNNLTKIVKIQKHLEENIERVYFKEVFDEVREDYQKLIADSKASIVQDLKVGSIQYTRANLYTIIYNFFSNALKYRSSERRLKIHISSFKEGNCVVLSVKDNGLGLSEAQRGKLFSMFKRFHSHTAGSGIGLYVAKRIIEDNGGRVEVHSKLDKGSEFKVYFKTQQN